MNFYLVIIHKNFDNIMNEDGKVVIENNNGKEER